ncbi:tyrosine-type recombinase/integrase [Spirosoma sp. HMF3257]|uniref:Tyr recombinase domain-containing protein n=1 Tax=Spirosoma telluris TaxID=2183553 RepID=A0A327NPW5_9BACT|nr:tyrosine-type recombinase/integrase [Spirosoma telluris]RAI76046.1 hypothetical protein HMF3257_21025 [Spirosoma telluris]
MNTKITYRLIYNRAGKLGKTGKAPVVIEAYQNPDRRYFSTGVKLKPSEWDKKKNEVKGNPAYNATISKQKAVLEDFELRFPSLYGRAFSLDDFDLMKNQDMVIKPKKQQSLTAFMLEQIEKDKSKLSYSAYTRYKRTVSNLIDFNQGQPVLFIDLDYEFVENYERYLRDTRPAKKYHPNTIVNDHKVIKEYIQKAVYMELIKASKNPYLQFTFKKEPSDKDVLYPEEIRRIEELTFSTEQQHLEFYRDTFLFSIYTLLRISDVTNLRSSNLTNTDKGLLLEIKSQKTRKTNSPHKLPLYDLHKAGNELSLPEQVLHKYAREDNRPIFNRSHPKLNEHIKTIAALAGITKRVTFHTARHSGITWLVILGLELPHIQKLAQHSTIATTMQYVHLAEHLTGERLSKIDWSKTKHKL